jgi:DNA uptake protein ComE-like DNA-binding protein
MSNTARRSLLAGRWYVVVIVCSFGLLAWLPFVHARRHLARPAITRLVWGYAAAAVLIGVLLAVTPRDARGEITSGAGNTISVIGGLLAIATIALGCVQQAPLRREVYGGAPPPAHEQVDPALATALEARERRATARQLAERDPLLARDLKIGRPDLSRTYDDGGLVDLNSAPAEVIAAVCHLGQGTGEEIAAARPPGGFMTVDDVFSLTDIPVAAWDVIRDRAVVIPGLS